jgi:hypothetical protein
MSYKTYYKTIKIYGINRIRKQHTTCEQNENTDSQQQKTKWVTFTYIGKETWRFITL